MKTLLLISIYFGLFAGVQSIADDGAPKVKKIDASRQETVRTALQRDISKGADSLRTWFGIVSICGPQLWSGIRSSIDKNGIEIIPVHFGSRDGAAFKGAESNHRFADQLAPLLAGGKIRMPTEDEVKAYWRIFPFDEIEEPFFIVASPKADLLVHLQWDADKKRYLVFLVEAFRLEQK